MEIDLHLSFENKDTWDLSNSILEVMNMQNKTALLLATS